MSKKLYKSRTDRALSGVCAGIAEYMNIDVVVVRLLMVIFCFMSLGTVLIAYIIAAIIIPEEPTVRMNNGAKQPVYETTYEYKTEGDTPAGGEAEFNTGGTSGPGSQAGGQESYGQQGDQEVRKSSGTWIIGIVLILMGSYMIVDWFFPWVSWRFAGAGMLIALGFFVLVKK